MSDATQRSPGAAGSSFSASRGYRNYVLGLLLLVYIFNFVDRQVLSILMPPIKAEFDLSDTQLGFLSGLAFAIFYTTLGIPIAKLADRSVRRTIVAVALAAWSVMTALSGAAVGFKTLLLARIGVGIGEAGCSPPAHSLISDYFPPQKRATALSIYAMGVYVGILVGLIAGGWLNQYYGWRVAFVAIGLPGILLAIVVRLTVREPPRGYSEGLDDTGDTPGLKETFRFLWARRAFRHLALASGFHAFAGYGISFWNPSYFVRVFDMSTGEAGTYLGLIIGICGGAGSFFGGLIADKVAARTGDARWYPWISGFSTLAAIPFAVGIYLFGVQGTALLSYIPVAFLTAMWTGSVYSMTQGLVGLRMRAVASAVLLLFINMIGLGLGPLTVGILSDLMQARFGPQALGYALFIVFTVANLWAATHYLLAARTLRADLASRGS